jgi:alanine dehydrogenase
MKLSTLFLVGAAVVGLTGSLATPASADFVFSGSGSSGNFVGQAAEPWILNNDTPVNNWGSPGVSAGTTPYLEAVAAFGLDLTFSGVGTINPAQITIGNNAGCVGTANRVIPLGAQYLERPHGGRGILLGGVPGVDPAEVVIFGAGVVGSNAALIAAGMQANVTVTARSADSMRRIAAQLGGRVHTVISTPEAIKALCKKADLVIATALVPGAMAPKLISAATVKVMKPGSVIVDVSIDQGGNAETSRPTTHSQPTYIVDGVVHYCVANMPGAVPRTSTFALNNATRPFVLTLADKGVRRALDEDVNLRNGLNVYEGAVTYRAVADAQGLPYMPLDAL